jgi:hypothetical protein
MNVIFLDCVGVVAGGEYAKNIHSFPGDSMFRQCLNEIDPRAVALLNQIVDQTQAKVVITSTWRTKFGFEMVERMLQKHGFTGEVIDGTPQTDGIRGNEIQAYLDNEPSVEKFVILDDGDVTKELSPFLVQTTWLTGLRQKHVEQAVDLLSQPNGDK